MNFEKYRLRKGLILAFHGCDLAVAEEVVTGRASLRRSENTYDWLGHGIYFWENNPERALEWAEAAAKRGRIQSPAVIGAILDLGHCLDLTETVGCEEVAKTYGSLRYLIAKGALDEVENSGGPDALKRHLDCSVINTLHYLRERNGHSPYTSVRAAFHERGELYPGAGFSRRAHIQICIRDEAAVLGYFLPRA